MVGACAKICKISRVGPNTLCACIRLGIHMCGCGYASDQNTLISMTVAVAANQWDDIIFNGGSNVDMQS